MRAVILFGHGSRDPQWREPMDAVARRMRALRPGLTVRCAFLELDTPSLVEAAEDAIAQGATRLTIVPMFLGVGRHAREDLPQLAGAIHAAHPEVQVELRPAVGEEPRLLDLLAELALS
jgi:sirohydrochlorin cobaltochelatase